MLRSGAAPGVRTSNHCGMALGIITVAHLGWGLGSASEEMLDTANELSYDTSL